MPSNQKKIRDLERLLKKHGDSAELQLKLEQARKAKDDVQVKEKTKKNATKYHMVKFVERKKVTRMIRALDSKIKKQPGSATVTSLEQKRNELLDDLAYIMYVVKENGINFIMNSEYAP